MKKYIWLLAIIFTCVFMFNIAPAFAKKPVSDPREGVPSDNSTCTGTAAGTCVTINGYTIKAFYYEDGDLVEVTDGALEGGNWPTINEGNTEYTYWAGRTDPDSSPPTASYLILDLEGTPVDADPPGAQLPLSQFNCGSWEIESSRIAFKINPNPTLSSDRDIVFKITEPAGYSYDTCSGNAFIRFNDGCYLPDSGTLMMPDSDGQSPWVQKRRFECSQTNAMLVEYEHCTEIPIRVDWEVGGTGGNLQAENIDYFIKPWILYGPGIPEKDGVRWRLDDLENTGPAKGTVLCTEDEDPTDDLPAPPVFLWKDRGYFANNPSGQ